MIVKARVVVVHPADEPDGDVLVAQQLLVRPHRGVVVDEVLPRLGPRREAGHERPQLRTRQVAAGPEVDHAATATARPPSRRATFAPTIAACAARPSGAAGPASTTGRSVPWTSWSMPTQRTTASIVRAP